MKRLIFSIKRFLLGSIANILQLIGLIVVLTAFFKWISILEDETRRNFDINQNINSDDRYIFYKLENFSEKFASYQETQAIAIFFLLLQIFRFLYFSPQIAKLLDVLTAAKIDIIFFMMLFSIVKLSVFMRFDVFL